MGKVRQDIFKEKNSDLVFEFFKIRKKFECSEFILIWYFFEIFWK